MSVIKLKKNLRTITANNAYRVQILTKKKKNHTLNVGSYNQKHNTLILDLKTFIFWTKKGVTLSGNFNKILKKTTANLQNNKKKLITIKY